nr:retrotransposon protein, putative, Ty1-copia subclass [Tanacetum cinerariifolium]
MSVLYVDDMLIACKSKAEIESTKSLLKKEFKMKELGEAKKILGMEIVRDRSRKIMRVSQSRYVSKILNNFIIDNGKSVKMSLGGHFKLSLKDFPIRDCDVERMSKVPFLKADPKSSLDKMLSLSKERLTSDAPLESLEPSLIKVGIFDQYFQGLRFQNLRLVGLFAWNKLNLNGELSKLESHYPLALYFEMEHDFVKGMTLIGLLKKLKGACQFPVKGLRFEHPEQLKKCLTNYGVANGYQLWYRRNDYQNLMVLCGKDITEGRCGGKKDKKGDLPTKKGKDEGVQNESPSKGNKGKKGVQSPGKKGN